ncbi:hypothetical protein HMPREF1587_01893 [Bifidobacterium breve JCP7499]|nr:hypothetical protein HMPREF1587_01893 [Bifidobacterium breve JCP7499]
MHHTARIKACPKNTRTHDQIRTHVRWVCPARQMAQNGTWW